MPTPNDRDFNREAASPEVYPDLQNPAPASQPLNSTNPESRPLVDRTAYRAGYANGQLVENQLRRDEQDKLIRAENQVVRDNDNAARGLLLGILLTSLVGLTVGAFALFNRRQPVPVAPVVIPNTSPAPVASPSPSPATNRETTVIERTTQVVPVPQRTIERVVVPAPAPQPPVTSPGSPLPQGTTSAPSPAPATTPATGTTNPASPGTAASPTGAAGQ